MSCLSPLGAFCTRRRPGFSRRLPVSLKPWLSFTVGVAVGLLALVLLSLLLVHLCLLGWTFR